MERLVRVLDLLCSHDFRLVFLLLEDRVNDLIALVKNGCFFLSVLADCHLDFV